MELVTAKRLSFAHAPVEVWAAMSDVDAYQQWWPWLRAFEARALATGEQWQCTVRPPLGYSVRFVIHFDEVVAESSVRAHVTGDIEGDASLALSTSPGGGTNVDVRSTLAPRSGFLRLLSGALSPVARYGHDWILSTGAAQFEARALDRRA